MEILLAGRSAPDPGVVEGLGARVVDLGELLTASDVVSLHCPLTPATHHLIGAAELRAMKPTAHLVNTARGPVVDEAALVAALEAGEIAGAGLDVFEDEPRVHPGLLDRDDVALLPHVGSATRRDAHRDGRPRRRRTCSPCSTGRTRSPRCGAEPVLGDASSGAAQEVRRVGSGTVPTTSKPRSRHKRTAAVLVSTTALNCIAA